MNLVNWPVKIHPICVIHSNLKAKEFIVQAITHLTNPRWMLAHAVVLLALATLISFGRWQLNRLEQRQDHNATVMTALARPVASLGASTIDPDDFTFQRVQITGEFDNQASIIIRNQQFQNQSGVDLVVPLKIENSDVAVLVNRGWIPRRNVDPSLESRQIYAVDGLVEIEGIAYHSQERPNRFAPLDPPLMEGETRRDAWFRINIPRIQEQVDYPLLPIYIEQLPTSTVNINNPPVADTIASLDDGPHFNYAIQWFSFALILAVTYFFFIRKSLQEDGY